jgi:hypothetical protein
MFESTLPFGTPDLIRVSDYRRYLDETVRPSDGDVGPSRLSSLNPSLAADLMRFEQARGPGVGLDVLEVMAACVRHSRSLLVQLQEAERVVPLTVFPYERLVHCPLRLQTLLAGRLTDLQVMHVEPAVLRTPGHPDLSLVGDPDDYAPLGPLLWELALRGARDELLPEISGMAAYRVSPGLDLYGLNLSGSLGAAVDRLKRQTTNLREIAEWPGFDRERATRLLNGLYLQAGLMVTRTHPAAKN